MLTSYYTVKKADTHEIIIQKSRFIGHVGRVSTEEEAQHFIDNIKKKHYNATHNCSAYLIGDNDHIQKANDDGEPSGTAGVPMLEVLKKMHFKNTVIVVTRYFGGIKLGAGGLIRAYSSSASETIKKAGVIEGILMQGFQITVPYHLLGKIEHRLQTSPYIIDHINYQENVELAVYVQYGQEQDFQNEMINLSNGQAEIVQIGKKYIEQDADFQ